MSHVKTSKVFDQHSSKKPFELPCIYKQRDRDKQTHKGTIIILGACNVRQIRCERSMDCNNGIPLHACCRWRRCSAYRSAFQWIDARHSTIKSQRKWLHKRHLMTTDVVCDSIASVNGTSCNQYTTITHCRRYEIPHWAAFHIALRLSVCLVCTCNLVTESSNLVELFPAT